MRITFIVHNISHWPVNNLSLCLHWPHHHTLSSAKHFAALNQFSLCLFDAVTFMKRLWRLRVIMQFDDKVLTCYLCATFARSRETPFLAKARSHLKSLKADSTESKGWRTFDGDVSEMTIISGAALPTINFESGSLGTIPWILKQTHFNLEVWCYWGSSFQRGKREVRTRTRFLNSFLLYSTSRLDYGGISRLISGQSCAMFKYLVIVKSI